MECTLSQRSTQVGLLRADWLAWVWELASSGSLGAGRHFSTNVSEAATVRVPANCRNVRAVQHKLQTSKQLWLGSFISISEAAAAEGPHACWRFARSQRCYSAGKCLHLNLFSEISGLSSIQGNTQTPGSLGHHLGTHLSWRAGGSPAALDGSTPEKAVMHTCTVMYICTPSVLNRNLETSLADKMLPGSCRSGCLLAEQAVHPGHSRALQSPPWPASVRRQPLQRPKAGQPRASSTMERFSGLHVLQVSSAWPGRLGSTLEP